MPRQREQLRGLPGDPVVRPQPVHGRARVTGVRYPAALDAALHRPPRAALVPVQLDQVGLRPHADVPVDDLCRQARGLLAEARHVDRWRHAGHGVQPCGVHLLMLAVIGELLAGEQLRDDRDGLLEHLPALLSGRPFRAGDVLVQGSPVPTPRLNLPSVSRLAVAAACAIMAGWIRVVGQVTAVATGRLVTWETAPMTAQTKLDCPAHPATGGNGRRSTAPRTLPASLSWPAWPGWPARTPPMTGSIRIASCGPPTRAGACHSRPRQGTPESRQNGGRVVRQGRASGQPGRTCARHWSSTSAWARPGCPPRAGGSRRARCYVRGQ